MTNAAMLLFGQAPQRFLISSEINSLVTVEKLRVPHESLPGNRQKTARKLPENRQKTARSEGQSPELPSLSDRILALLRQNPSAGRREIAATLGTTRSIVRYRLDKLRAAGKIERVGPDKGGYWKVLGESAVEADPVPERDAG